MENESFTRRKFLETTSVGIAGASLLSFAPAVSNNANTLAIQGGTPVRTKPYPDWPQTFELDEQNILKSLRNHRWCTFDGEFIPKFEKAWAEKIGTKGCVMMPCGTHALHTALEILDIAPGDEVLVSPFTYIATIDVILLNYALPVFVDSDLATFQMNPDDIERRITKNTRAILPVHIYGAPANMDKILAIAKKHNLPVIEDACQSHMAEWRGKKVSTLGTVGCFSFQESKNLPGGEAGALVSNDEKLIEKSYIFRDFGRNPKAGSFIVRGTKYRISDFAAAILMAQLTRFDEISATREKNAAYLTEELKKIPGIIPQQHYPESTRQSYYVYGLRYDKTQFNNLSRSKFIDAVKSEGIPIGAGYTPLNKEPFIENTLNSRGYQRIFSKERLDWYRKQNNCPKNDELCETSLTLPQTVLIGSKKDVDDVIEAISKVKKKFAKM